MKKVFLCLLPLAALAACGDPVASAGSTPPPILEQTTLDERSLLLAYSGLDAAAETAKYLVRSGKVVPGSETARKISAGLKAVKSALNAAKALKDAGSSAGAQDQFNAAVRAYKDLRGLLGG